MAETTIHIMAIDCCEHVIAAFESVPTSRLTSVASKGDASVKKPNNEIDLIVIGVPRYPVRRLFISQLRYIYPEVPVLILRREVTSRDDDEGRIFGQFILSDQGHRGDLEIVKAVRQVLPLQTCTYLHRSNNYDMVHEIIRVIAEKYFEPGLDLSRVATALPISPSKLSRILNQEVRVSFRQLLRQVRIEEAKRMLTTRQYSVKEVAARVGFSDSHYFSRSFKELTGLSASEYRSQDPIFG